MNENVNEMSNQEFENEEINDLFKDLDLEYSALKQTIAREFSDYKDMLAREKRQASIYKNKVQVRDVMYEILPILSDIKNDVLDSTDLDELKMVIKSRYKQLLIALSRVGVKLQVHERNQHIDLDEKINGSAKETNDPSLHQTIAYSSKMGCIIRGEEDSPILEDVEIYVCNNPVICDDTAEETSDETLTNEQSSNQFVDTANDENSVTELQEESVSYDNASDDNSVNESQEESVSYDNASDDNSVNESQEESVSYDNACDDNSVNQSQEESTPYDNASDDNSVNQSQEESVSYDNASDNNSVNESQEESMPYDNASDNNLANKMIEAILYDEQYIQFTSPVILKKSTKNIKLIPTDRIVNVNDGWKRLCFSQSPSNQEICSIWLDENALSNDFSIGNIELYYRVTYDKINMSLVLEFGNQKNHEILVQHNLTYVNKIKSEE